MFILYTPHFKREAKRIPLSLRATIEERINLFMTDPFHSSLKAHKLSGKLQDYWAFSIDYRIRIIYKFVDKKTAIFHSIGDHSIYG